MGILWGHTGAIGLNKLSEGVVQGDSLNYVLH